MSVTRAQETWCESLWRETEEAMSAKFKSLESQLTSKLDSKFDDLSSEIRNTLATFAETLKLRPTPTTPPGGEGKHPPALLGGPSGVQQGLQHVPDEETSVFMEKIVGNESEVKSAVAELGCEKASTIESTPAEVLSALFSINSSPIVVLRDAEISEYSKFINVMVAVKRGIEESMTSLSDEACGWSLTQGVDKPLLLRNLVVNREWFDPDGRIHNKEIGGLTEISIDCVRISDVGCPDMGFKYGLSEFRPPAKPPNGGYFDDGLYWVYCSRFETARRMAGTPKKTSSSPYQILGNRPIDHWKVTELKEELKRCRFTTKGFKDDMVKRLEEALRIERVPFLFLCVAVDMNCNESGRIVMTDIECNMLRTIIKTTSDDLVAAVYLSANRVDHAHEGVELRIGDASIIKALAEACRGKEAHIKNHYKEKGNLGLVAKENRSSQSMMRKPAALTVAKVFDTFRIIAKESGKDSQEKKKNHIKSLLVAATDCEPQYLNCLLQSKLRIGYAEQTLLAALGQAVMYAENCSKPPPNISSPLEEDAKIVKQVYSVLPVYDKIIVALLRDCIGNLTKTGSFTIGIPVGPMLAKPTKGVSEIIEKFQDMVYTCEYKYDGERAHIHYREDGSVEIYSRNAERNTGKYPDVAVAVTRLKKPSVTSFVLDCEIVAYDRDKKRILPFQILSTRARKNVVAGDIKVNVCIYAFDILFCNGQSRIKEQLNRRRQHLYDSFEEEPGYFQFETSITSKDLEEIQKFLEAAVDSSCEGLIINTLYTDATYEPSKRSNNCPKLKKDYMDGVGDSLDLVLIGAFHGRGKRTGVYGAFLLACYDPDKEEFQSNCLLNLARSLSEDHDQMKQLYSLLDSSLKYSAMIAMFSQPRPPEDTNLVDKVFEEGKICCRENVYYHFSLISGQVIPISLSGQDM